MLTNFPKIQCPFVRREYDIDRDDWEKYGRQLQLRRPVVYLATTEITPGYEWVIEDPKTFAVEKLDGTNIKLETAKGRLIQVQNRKNPIDLLQVMAGKPFLVEGVFMAIQKGFVLKHGVQAGEVIGPKLQGNPYKMDTHLFYPFEKAIKHLSYRSFHEHDRTFENWSSWFKEWLVSRFATKRGTKGVMAEGVIFYNLKRRVAQQTYMAKLRRDMFEWYYSDKIKIHGYPENPRPYERENEVPSKDK